MDADYNATPRLRRVACHENAHPLTLKRGVRRVWRFAHSPPAPSNVEACRESAIHLRAKNELATVRGEAPLPQWQGYSFVVRIVAGEVEATDFPNGRRPDALWRTDAGEEFAVEVRYSNPKGGSYANDMAAQEVPALEVDVRGWYDTVKEPPLAERIASTGKWVAVPFGPFHQMPAPALPLEASHLADKVEELAVSKAQQEHHAARQAKDRQARAKYGAKGFRLGGDGWRRERNGVVMVIPVVAGMDGLEDAPDKASYAEFGAWRFRDNRHLAAIERPDETLARLRAVYQMAATARSGGNPEQRAAADAAGAPERQLAGNLRGYKGHRIHQVVVFRLALHIHVRECCCGRRPVHRFPLGPRRGDPDY